MKIINRKAFYFTMIFWALSCSKADPQKMEETKIIAKEAASKFAPPMVAALFAQMEKSGASEAVEFCSGFANEHSQEINDQLLETYEASHQVSSFSIGRTSLKYRNPDNRPDEFEREVLQQWEAGEEKGEKAAPRFGYSKGTYYGIMPIRLVSEKCLACHGPADLRDAQAYAKINRLYPDDQAIDYRLDQLRGAISVKVEY